MVTECPSLKDSSPWHAKSKEKVLAELETSPSGLKESEAKRRLLLFGPNTLKKIKGKSFFSLFLSEFKNFLILILLGAIVFSFLVGDYPEGIVILAIVFIAALLSALQNYRAERVIEELKRITPNYVRVLREGKEKTVRSEEVVPGDVVILNTGDKVPADCYLLSEVTLKVDESILTGESVPVEKDVCVLPPEAPLFARRNLLFSATSVVYGKGKAVVYATGMNTEFGKIAQTLTAIEEEKTPLQISLNKLGKWFGILSLLVGIFFGILASWRGEKPTEILVWAIAVAVAIVPEALPVVLTVALSLGVKRMAKRKGLVKRIASVETFGTVNIICSDKTGTITKGEMSVKEIYLATGERIEVTGVGYEPKGEFLFVKEKRVEEELDTLLLTALLCNDARLRREGEKWIIDGDPTEGALLVCAQKKGLKREEIEEKYPRVDEIPFTPERKLMTTVHKKGERFLVATKGAGEIVLSKCQIEEKERGKYLSVLHQMAERGLRVLAIAGKEREELISDEGVEENLQFFGFVGMMDLPRPEVKPAIEKCRSAGIRPIMITGDHILTAQAVASEIGLKQKEDGYLTGEELDRMGEEELMEKIEKVSVISRVLPAHKLKVVSALQRKGYVVAMTGDGVNDAPALKKADVGVAMGITGSEVCKEVADLIILDDNFATIVHSIEEGRNIFKNTKNFITYSLSLHLGEFFTILISFLFGFPLPLTAAQILFLNLVTDGLPPIALGLEPIEPDLMTQPPRGKKESFFTRRNVGMSLILALLLTTQTIFLFHSNLSDVGKARTIALATFTLSAMFACLVCRSERLSIFKLGFFRNRELLFALFSTVFLLLLILYLPALSRLFATSSLSLSEWLLVILFTFPTLLLGELVKRII